MVLFTWGWSRLIHKRSLIRSLNLFVPETRISKWSKSIKQLHSSRWSGTADCLTHLRRFPVKLEIPMCSAALVKKWRCFTIISNLAVTTHVSVNNVRADLFLKGIFIMEQWIQLGWWLEKVNLKLFSNHHASWIRWSVIKIPFRKRSLSHCLQMHV